MPIILPNDPYKRIIPPPQEIDPDLFRSVYLTIKNQIALELAVTDLKELIQTITKLSGDDRTLIENRLDALKTDLAVVKANNLDKNDQPVSYKNNKYSLVSAITLALSKGDAIRGLVDKQQKEIDKLKQRGEIQNGGVFDESAHTAIANLRQDLLDLSQQVDHANYAIADLSNDIDTNTNNIYDNQLALVNLWNVTNDQADLLSALSTQLAEHTQDLSQIEDVLNHYSNILEIDLVDIRQQKYYAKELAVQSDNIYHGIEESAETKDGRLLIFHKGLLIGTYDSIPEGRFIPTQKGDPVFNTQTVTPKQVSPAYVIVESEGAAGFYRSSETVTYADSTSSTVNTITFAPFKSALAQMSRTDFGYVKLKLR